MIENTYVEIGTGIGLVIGAIAATLKFSNGKGGKAKSETSKIDVSKFVKASDCKEKHQEVKADQELNRKEHKDIAQTCSYIQKDVAVLIERTKPKGGG